MEIKNSRSMSKKEIAEFRETWESMFDKPAIIVPIEPAVILVGCVTEREIDYGNDVEFITDVTDDYGLKLSELLENFIGERIKITIEKL